ncbi:MAG: hypothetical protein ACP5T0_12210 [Verrucomicrobiia bacterium]
MKLIENIVSNIRRADKVVARFGNARLVRNQFGRYELRGGNRNEQAQALEWISLFMHEATPVIKADDEDKVVGF